MLKTVSQFHQKIISFKNDEKCFLFKSLKRSFRSPHVFGLFFDNIFLWLHFYNSQNFSVRLDLALEKRSDLYILIVDVSFNDIINLEIHLSCRIKSFLEEMKETFTTSSPGHLFAIEEESYFLKMRWAEVETFKYLKNEKSSVKSIF